MTVKKKANTTSKPPHRGKSGSKRSKKFGWKGFLARLVFASLLLFFLFFLIVYLGFFGKVPSSDELNGIKTPLSTEVFSTDGRLLGRYYVENRSYVKLKDISPEVVNALIATEDARFYQHRGIDHKALLRVLFKTIFQLDRSGGGGSTLSQQIAKNLYPRINLGILTIPAGKIREAIIAYRLEKIYSKEEVLTLYLNTVPFGENIFGIEVAAERYFNKSPSKLTVPEAAALIGMLKANHVFNPRLHPEKSLQRRNLVIDQMVKYGYLDSQAAENHKATPLGLNYRVITYNQGPAPYLLEHLRPALLSWCKAHTKPNGENYNLYTDGLKVYTTVDYNMQRYATLAVAEHMKNLQQVFDNHWKGRNPWGNDQSVVNRAVRRSDRYRNAKARGKSDSEIEESFRQPIESTLFTWDGITQRQLTPLDSIKHYLRMLNAGFLAMEPYTGEVKAWVGGIDFRFFKYDYIKAARQAGSTFKPFVYLAALENGLSPFDYYPNERKVYPQYKNWSPSNANDNYEGYYSMKAALSQSINTVSAQMIMKTGISNTIKTARELGITAELPEYPSLALGAASVPLIQMVTAYSALLNGGRRVEPQIITHIENNDGELLQLFHPESIRDTNVDPENCRIIVEMLRSVIDEGTGRSIRSVYGVTGDFIGKTGTTQDHADGWFIGCNPTLVAGCWVGADDPAVHFRTISYGQGAYMALPVVGKFFNKLYSDPRYRSMKERQFESPDPDTVERLNEMVPYREKLPSDFNLKGLFKRRDRDDDRPRDRKQEQDEDKEPVWEKIKRIFRKQQ